MNEITLTVPDALGDLPKGERDLLLGRALRTATKERITQVTNEVNEGMHYIRRFEKKYGMKFDEFEKKLNSLELEGVSYQEDYHDWYFWIESTRRAERVLATLQRFLST
ncbi:MAG: hypothetical protein O2954_07970 [bacterium]|nr:hypothetical protein [bacterium]